MSPKHYLYQLGVEVLFVHWSIGWVQVIWGCINKPRQEPMFFSKWGYYFPNKLICSFCFHGLSIEPFMAMVQFNMVPLFKHSWAHHLPSSFSPFLFFFLVGDGGSYDPILCFQIEVPKLFRKAWKHLDLGEASPHGLNIDLSGKPPSNKTKQ